MIAFASLFLGLVVGPHPVELLVKEPVAAVEIVLDGSVVATLERRPWSLQVDFGELSPHRLEAIAYDDGGEEVGRALQWINLPHQSAEARLVLDLSPDGQGSRGRLIYKSVTAEQPSAVRLALDGRELETHDRSDFALPDYDPDLLHFLRAEVEFPDNVLAVAEATFGGRYADEISTLLTAVPVVAEVEELPRPEALDALVSVAGARARVAAVEKGPAEVVLVRDLAVERPLVALGRGVSYARRARLAEAFGLTLGEDDWLRIFWTVPETRHRNGESFVLFPRSQDFGHDEGSFYFQMVRARWPLIRRSQQQIADAVAVAGLSAAERGRRRTVVLVLHDPLEDRSQLTARQARQYLATLRVPLRVWSTKPRAWRKIAGAAWGDVVDVSSIPKLSSAISTLRRELEQQRIVWIDGVHLPQEIAVAQESGLQLLR